MTEFLTSPKFPGYGITKDGSVIELKSGNGIEPRTFRGKRTVFIIVNRKRVGFEVGRMVLHAFCPLMSPAEVDHLWGIEYIDGDKWNTSLINLRWVGPKNPLPYEKDCSFFYIPEFTRYVMSKDGEIMNVRTGKIKSITFPKSRDQYPYLQMRKDTGKDENVHFHRIMMLTFRPIYFNGLKLVVNHLDGIKWNCYLDNMEWTTYSGNMDHAVREGLRNDNKPVKIKDILTGEVKIFYSMAECGRFFGKTTERIWKYLHCDVDKVRFNHFIIRWIADERPWPNLTVNECFKPLQGTPKPIIAKNIVSGDEQIFPMMKDAMVVTGVPPATIGYYLKNNIPKPKNGWVFKFVHDDRPWPDVYIKEGEKFWVNGKPRRSSLYKVTNMKTGEVFELNGLLEVSKLIGISERTIDYHRRRSFDGLRCKDFKIEKIKKGPSIQ